MGLGHMPQRSRKTGRFLKGRKWKGKAHRKVKYGHRHAGRRVIFSRRRRGGKRKAAKRSLKRGARYAVKCGKRIVSKHRKMVSARKARKSAAKHHTKRCSVVKL